MQRVTLIALLTFIAARNVSAEPAVTIRIYDQSGLSSVDLNRAAHELTVIYQSAGIESAVRNCPSPDSCPEQFAVNEVGIRLVPGPCRFEASRLAEAFIAHGGNLSTVYVAAVSEAASRSGVNTGRILGYVFAHEVAHLFGLRHSAGGVMRTGWTDSDYRAMGNGGLLFTRGESKAMQSRIGARQNGVRAAAVARDGADLPLR